MELEGYEKWPGFRRLKDILEDLLMHSNGNIQVCLTCIQWQQHAAIEFPAMNAELVLPKDKREFEQSGRNIRLAFDIDSEEIRSEINRVTTVEFERYALSRCRLSTNIFGQQYRTSQFFNPNAGNQAAAHCLNIKTFGDERYELGFDSSGNIQVALLEIVKGDGVR